MFSKKIESIFEKLGGYGLQKYGEFFILLDNELELELKLDI